MKFFLTSSYPARRPIHFNFVIRNCNFLYATLVAIHFMLPSVAVAQATSNACMFNDTRNLHLDLNHWVHYGRLEHVSDSLGSDAADNYADDNGTYVNISGRACPLTDVADCPADQGLKAIFLRGRFNRDNSGRFEGFDQRYHILKPAIYDKTERRSWSGGVNDTRNSKVVVSGYSDDAGPGGVDGCDEDIRVHATLWRDLWRDEAPFQGNVTGGRVNGIDIDKNSFAFGLSNFDQNQEFVVTGMEVDGGVDISSDASVADLTDPEKALERESEGFYYIENIITGAYEFRPLNVILGATSSQTRDVNDDFFVVGSLKKPNGDIRAFVYDPLWDSDNDGVSRAKLHQNVVELPPLPGDTESYAMSINDYFISTSPYLAGGAPYSGQVFGFSVRYVDGVKRIRAAAWNPDYDDQGQMTFTSVDLLNDWPTDADPASNTPDSAIFAANSFGMAVGFRTKPNEHDPSIMVRYAMLYRDGQDKIVDLNRSSAFQFEYEPTDTKSFLQSATAVSDSGLTAAGGTGPFNGATREYSFIQSPVYFQSVKLPSIGESYVGKIAKMSSDGSKAVGCTSTAEGTPEQITCQQPLLLSGLPTITNRYSNILSGNGGETSGQAFGLSSDGLSAVGATTRSPIRRVKWDLNSGLPTSSTGIASLSSVSDVGNSGAIVGKYVAPTGYRYGVACPNGICPSTPTKLYNPRNTSNPACSASVNSTCNWRYESEPIAINAANIVGGYYLDNAIGGASKFRAALWNVDATVENNSVTLPVPTGADTNSPSVVLAVSNRDDGKQFAVGYATKADGSKVAAQWEADYGNLAAATGTLAGPDGSSSSELRSVNSAGQSVGRVHRPFALRIVYAGEGSSGEDDLAYMYDFNRRTLPGYQAGDEFQLVRNLAAPNDGILMAAQAVAINDSTEIIVYGLGMDGQAGYWKLIPPPSIDFDGNDDPLNFACDPIPEYPPQPAASLTFAPALPELDPVDGSLGGLDILGLGLLTAAYWKRRSRHS